MKKQGGISIGRKLLVVLAGVLLMSTGAVANDVDNLISSSGGATFIGALHTDNADFTDVFTIAIKDSATVNISLLTIGSGLNNIDFVSADLNGHALTFSPNGFVETGSLGDLDLKGPLVLTVTGKSGAADGTFASYSGVINIVLNPKKPR